jgi:bifunctional non-homologous end joining protein LigD
VVEIKYLYAYKGGSLYQPIYQGKRDDIEPAYCTTEQLKFKGEEES